MILIKTIGIITRNFIENNKEFMGTRQDLIDTINRFRVNIITIPITMDYKKIINNIILCDGIILSRGSLFHHNDFKVIRYLYKKNIPTLGICLGMQGISECFGKRLEKDIENHYLTNHQIKIKKDSLLYKILKKDKITVNSRHHSTF